MQVSTQVRLRTMMGRLKQLTMLIALMSVAFAGKAQFSIAAGSTDYTQNFNSLTTAGTWTNNSTLTGWYARTTATASITAFGLNTGSTINPAGLYSYGNSGDRALGYVTSNAFTGAASSGKNFLGWRLVNNTGSEITSITVTWTGEQWRRDNTNAHTLQLFYRTGATVTDLISGTWTSASSVFTSPQTGTALALDGNNAANREAGIVATITVSIPAGEEIMLRWEDLNDASNDHHMAIDDVTVNATVALAIPPVVDQELYLGTVGTPASFQIIASESPTSYAIATGTLPGGLNLNTTTGEISGTPNEAGYFELEVNATNGAGTSADETIAIDIEPGDQTITFGALSNVFFNDAPFNLTGTASSGLTVSYMSSNPLVATIAGNTVTIVGAGSTTITASQSGNANWNAAVDVPQTLTVDKSGQTITFDPLPNKLDTDPDFNLTATSTSGLTISYLSSDPLVATISGNTVTITGVGTTTITASQAGDDNYDPATPVDQTLTVNNAGLLNQTITFGALSDATYGDASFNLTATASSGLTVTYASSDDNVASVSGNTVTINGPGSVTITASQAGNGSYNPAPNVDQSFDVDPKNLTVSGLIAEDKPYDGNATATLDFTGASLVGVVGGDDVDFGGTAAFDDADAGVDKNLTTSLTLSGTDAGKYTLTQPTLTATISQASQTITFDPLAPKTTADAPFALTGTASSGLTVEYNSSNPLVATVSGNTVTITGSGSTTITASQPGNTNYSAATSVDQVLTVTAAPSTVTWTFTGPSAAPTGVPSGVTISNIDRGNGFGGSPAALLTTTSPSSGYTGATGTFNAGVAANTGALDIDESAYFEFVITPANGKLVTISGVTFGTRSTGTAPQAYSIRSSKDGYATSLMTGTIANNSTWSLKDDAFTSTTVPYTTPVTIRIYGYNGTGNPTQNTTNWRIDDVNLSMLVENMPACSGTPEAGTATNDGGSSFCVSGSTNLSLSGYDDPNEIDGISIQWFSSTDNVNFDEIVGEDQPTLSTGTITATTYYYAEVSCSFSGLSDVTNTITVEVNQIPVVDITGTLSFCTAGSTTLTATAGDSYQWYDVNGIIGAATNQTLEVSVAGGYYVEVTTNGCTGTSGVVNVSETTAPPAPVVSGPTNVCPFLDTNEEVVFTVDPIQGATSYNWTVPPAVSIVSGQGTNTLTVTIGMGLMTSANKQIRVTVSNDCGVSPMTIFYMLVQAPSTPDPITGPTDACSYVGTPAIATYSIPAVTAATSYIWNVPTGVTIVNDFGTSIEVTFDNSFVTDAITVRALNNCGVSTARSITVTKTNPSAPSLISGPTNACLLMPTPQNPAGIPATYSVDLVGGNTYVWAVPAGVTITNQGTTVTTSFIDVEFSGSFTSGNIGVYAVNGCGNSSTRTLKLSRLRPATPSGIDQLEVQACPGRTITYSLSSMPANASYIDWTIPANGTIISGQGTSSITVSYDDVAIDGNVTATGVNGCQTSLTRTLKVKLSACEAPPPPPPFAKGDDVKATIGTAVKVLNATIFPNPSTDVFRMKVDASGMEKVLVSVFDITGRPYTKLVAQPGQTITFGNELRAGTYLVELVQGKERKVVKVIKH